MHKSLPHSRPSLTCATLLLSFALAALAAPGDWPQFRGPNRDGASAETGLLQELPSGGPPLVWKAAGLGVGYSSVSVVGDHIYTMGENNEFSSVLDLNAADGKQVSEHRIRRISA
jgi:outer membrane protein assembly factor BamB